MVLPLRSAPHHPPSWPTPPDPLTPLPLPSFPHPEVIPLTITLASAQQKSSATDGSLLDVSDENHPSHPSTTGNTSVVPVKKGRKKAPAAAASTTAEGATKAGSGVAQWAGAAKPPAGGDATLMEVDG